MRVRLLGTAASEGWPALFCRCPHCERARAAGGRNVRTRCEANVDGEYQFDFGPDANHHALLGNDLSKVRHVLFTHSHSDHLNAGDLEMQWPPYAHGATERLHIYGNGTVLSHIRERLGAEARRLELHRLTPFQEVVIGDARLVPLLADHDRSEECLIHLFGLRGRWLLYGHDTTYPPPATWDAVAAWAAQGHRIHAALLDCTYGPDAESAGHMGVPEASRVREGLIEVGAADRRTRWVLTHFSHNGGLIYDEMVEHARPMGFEVAYDGMELDV